jgi:hypothetical protein
MRKVDGPVLVAEVAELRRETGWLLRVGFEVGIRLLAAELR